MSPHQRVLTRAASAVKSRRIRSARAAAAESGMVVFFHRFAARPRTPRPAPDSGLAHQPGDPLASVPVPVPAQRGVDPRGAIPALRFLMDRRDLPGELGVLAASLRRLPGAGGVVGGTGDFQQLARPLDVAPARFLRLDERVHAHRVSFAKKAVARLRISTSSRSRRLSRRSCASFCRSVLQAAVLTGTGITLALLQPLPDRSLGQVEVFRDLTNRPVAALAQLNDLGLELRGEGAAAPGLLPHALHDRTSFGGKPLMMDVRQSGSGSHLHI
jgi:hypothetical protein